MTAAPKFKIGDRVVIVAPHDGCPEYGRAGDVGIINSIDRDGDLWLDGVGDPDALGERGVCYAQSRVRHVDPRRVMIVDSIGASVAALVEHLDTAASEHLVALDGLRKENEGLRIVAHNLRTQRDEDVARINALEAELARLQHLVDESRRVHEANAQDVDAKPVREVVRGLLNDTYPQMVPPEFAKYANWLRPPCFSASFVGGVWIAYEDGADFPKRHGLTEPEAIDWVLDGVLPDESRVTLHPATTP